MVSEHTEKQKVKYFSLFITMIGFWLVALWVNSLVINQKSEAKTSTLSKKLFHEQSDQSLKKIADKNKNLMVFHQSK